jgi:hypothetical protein
MIVIAEWTGNADYCDAEFRLTRLIAVRFILFVLMRITLVIVMLAHMVI